VKRVFDIVGRADEPANTSVAVRLSFKDRLNDPAVTWGPAFSDPAAITYRDLRRYAKIEVTLNSADGIASPAVYEYGLEIERDAGVLLRGDGSEYYGGIIVDSMPAVSYPPNEQARRDRYGNPDFTELFRASGSKELKGLRLMAFRRGGVQPAHHDAARGPRKFRIEHNGLLYVVRILEMVFEIQGRETENGFGVWIADGVDAEVLKIRELA
ncbi:MAG: hypothetical protein M3P49_02960, partial [Actinomycetota bacterium]|nr:hypothetical protein [Actinomycetota bacterium]